MKTLILHSGVLTLSILIFGTAFAQETGVPDSTSPFFLDTNYLNAVNDHPNDSIYDFTDVEASFKGGDVAFREYMWDHFDYPKEALKNNEQGRVYVVFVVEIDGAITGVNVMRGGVTELLNNAAMKLVREMPNWNSAEINGIRVRSRCRLPIRYRSCS